MRARVISDRVVCSFDSILRSPVSPRCGFNFSLQQLFARFFQAEFTVHVIGARSHQRRIPQSPRRQRPYTVDDPLLHFCPFGCVRSRDAQRTPRGHRRARLD
eukprot:30936-Pelagococcus_subviridis.AAC.33